ncbi:MAG: ATP-dependent zinc metalloprotease FtsH [Gemmatimonadaceae bacterium]|nr:ATP-dependent zinc metalloprotease FtsH [Gemmatimonadaceae bacterium]
MPPSGPQLPASAARGTGVRRNGTTGDAPRDPPTTRDGGPGAPNAPATGGGTMPPRRTWLTFLAILLANVVLARACFPPEQVVTVPYTLFKQEVARRNVAAIYSRGASITGRFVSPVRWPRDSAARGDSVRTDSASRARPAARTLPPLFGSTRRQPATPRNVTDFATELPAFADPGLEAFLDSNQVVISAEPIQEGNTLVSILVGFAPTLLLIGVYVWFFRRASKMGGGLGGALTGGLGRSTARRVDTNTENRVTFADVAGIDEAENELVELVDYLRDPQKYTRLGGAAPKGVLLVGAPGTGKTLLARAVAGEANVPFFSMSASEFVEMVVGVGAARVRDLFRQARESAPAIIFIDELDSIGRARGATAIGGSSEQEQTLNQILTEMDGFSGRQGIIVLAATNQPDVLDRALLRPGRFDRRVVVNAPDKRGREAILTVHTRTVPLASDVSLPEIAAATPGLTGADLRNLVNEAALLAARREQQQVRQKDFLDALEKIVLGPERPLLMSAQDRERVAYHEGGHAILGLVVPGADPVHRVTIVPRGQALGVTYQRPDADRYNYPEGYLRARIVGILGGRAAEEVVYGTRTTGAQNDIEQATSLARNMVTRWGMSDRLGMVQLAPRENMFLAGPLSMGAGGGREISEATAQAVDDEIRRIIAECHEQAVRLLREHRTALDALVTALLDRETLDEREILSVTGLPPAPQLDNREAVVTAAR